MDKVNCDLVNNTKHCECPVGYEDVSGSCEDINECLTNNTCHPTAKCINTIGSFECECEEGYRKPEREDACEDINEYEESWLPVGIAVGTAVFLIIISLALLKYMDYRASR
ncbi:hypothetical protein TNIN_487321 [Trichonephila inaurata madagascariensis]|uniref:EGF-like domain-containing protein n=1 Tax=Trichonephila inaurata madagascariensis TaxID=2747483 RepID=A0A8X6MKM1_9ARAC|nr:hypothetical protein TNIN_487321 [Trichonephila inaurata madagascariensis]